MTAIWSFCLTPWMRRGERMISWTFIGYPAAMKRLRTSLSRRLALSLHRRRRRRKKRRRRLPPLRELRVLRNRKWWKSSQKWWKQKRLKWSRCSKSQRWRRCLAHLNLPLQWQPTNNTPRSQMHDVSRLSGRHQSGLLTERPRLEVMANSLFRWPTRIMPFQLDQRVHIIRTELNGMNAHHLLCQKWVIHRERKGSSAMLCHIVNYPLIDYSFAFVFLCVVVGVNLLFPRSIFQFWTYRQSICTFNPILIQSLHHIPSFIQSVFVIFERENGLKSSHFGIIYEAMRIFVSSLMERLCSDLHSSSHGIALSQDEWRVVIRSLVCLFRFDSNFQSSFELESVIFWVSAHLSFLWISIFNTVNVLTMLSKPCIAIFCVCFCFYCFRSNLPIDRESYHLLHCIIRWKSKILKTSWLSNGSALQCVHKDQRELQRVREWSICSFPMCSFCETLRRKWIAST